eukprot:3118614-Alexandrium_andersonii.AAC.1
MSNPYYEHEAALTLLQPCESPSPHTTISYTNSILESGNAKGPTQNGSTHTDNHMEDAAG